MAKKRWADPEPLVHSPPPPPLDALPPVLARYVAAVGVETQTPPDLALMYALAVLSGATRNAWRVTVREGWSEQLTLWTLVLLPSGNLKSTVETRVMAPLRHAEAALVEAHDSESPALEAKYAIAKKRADDARKDAINGTGDDEEAAQLAKIAESIRPPARPRLYATDSTPEAAAIYAADQGGVMSVYAAEGAFLQNLAGRYSDNKPNLSFVNDAWSGKDTRVLRAGRQELYIPRPALTLGLSLQNDLARGLGKGDMDGSGFLSRFLFAVPHSLLGARDLAAPPVSAALVKGWDAALQGVLDQAGAWWSSANGSRYSDNRTELSLNKAAQRVLMEHREDVEPQLAPGGDLAGLAGWGAKLPGNCIRIAGLFALLDRPTTHLIRGEHMRAAVSLAPYLTGQAQVAYSLMRQSRAVPATPEQKVMTWVAEEVDEGEPFKFEDVRKVMRKHAWAKSSEVGEAAVIRAVLGVLVEKGWLRKLPREASGRGRPATRYEAHPSTWEEWG